MKLIAALLALAAPVALAAQPAAPAATATDWTAQVEQTAEGGWRMGNPDAALKLVEYGSITCSHCADFEREQGQAVRDQVRTGRVSFEYRPFLIFPSDPGIFLLLSCQSPDRFFGSVRTLYESQEDWVAKLEAKQAQWQAEVQRTSFGAALPAIVSATETDAHFRAGGLSNQQIAACLTDGPRMQRLATANQQARERGVQGTPTFYLNDRQLQVATYADVTAALRQP